MSGSTRHSVTTLAANLATLLFAVVIVLQLLLAAGVLPITMAWGGRQLFLTPALRLASVAAAVILALFAYVIRRRAGLLGDAPPSRAVRVVSWLITTFLVVNTLGNLASVSPGERLLFTPLSFLLALSCLVVSLSKPDK